MKQYFLFVILVLMVKTGFSQISFSHSFGGAYYFSAMANGSGVLYSPRLNLIDFDDNASVSIGTHLGLGIKVTTGAEDVSLIFDAPLVVEFNYGCGCTTNSHQDFGFFAGAGFGYNKMAGKNPLSDYAGSSAGLVINGGIRGFLFAIPIGFRLSYLINMKHNGANNFGIGMFYVFGDYY